MNNAFEKAFLLNNYQDNYPMLASLDPTTITRAVLAELRTTLSVIIMQDDNVPLVSFGKDIASVVAIEFAKIDSDYILTPKDGQMIINESKQMALELLDHIRTVPNWITMNFTMLTAEYLRSGNDDVGVVIRFIETADPASVYGDLNPAQVSDFVVASVRTIIGR